MHNTYRVERNIADYLVPKDLANDKDFWITHWCNIQYLGDMSAILEEHLHFFEKDYSRAEAGSLIAIVDMCWQSIRRMAGKKGDDLKWLNDYLPSNHDSVFPENSQFSYNNDVQVVEDIKWVFELHSCLRHPEKIFLEAPFIFNDPWPAEQASRLIKAAKNLDYIFDCISGHFEESGFVDEIEQKKIYAEKARLHSNKMRKDSA